MPTSAPGGSSSPPSSGGRRSGRRWCRSSPRAPGPGSRPSTPTRCSTSTGWPRTTARSSPPTFCHATYLINLASDDPALLERSVDCLAANLTAATGMGASGLVLHVGSHKGSGFADCVPQVVDALGGVLGRVPAGSPITCPILLENAAGTGGTVGRSFEELADPSRRRRARTRPPPGRLHRYAASVGLGDRLHLGGGGRRRRGHASTPSSGWTGCGACTSTTPRSSWGRTGTATPTWARGPSGR